MRGSLLTVRGLPAAMLRVLDQSQRADRSYDVQISHMIPKMSAPMVNVSETLTDLLAEDKLVEFGVQIT
jgi:hypothetical protein